MGGNGVPKSGRRGSRVGEWVMRFGWVTGVVGAEGQGGWVKG